VFKFIKLQFERAVITAEQVKAFTPRFITEEQAASIIGEV